MQRWDNIYIVFVFEIVFYFNKGELKLKAKRIF